MTSQNESNEPLELIHWPKPSLELAEIAQQIGYEAWSEQLDRSDDEIRHTFNPDSPQAAEKLLGRMSEKEGRFVGLVGKIGEVAVGYGWAVDDKSTSPAKLAIKKVLGLYTSSYAWIAQLNVLPGYQGLGYGTTIASNLLGRFDYTQKPSIYVFEENQKSLALFQRWGFAPRPNHPELKLNYFGRDSEPAMQYRLEAQNVGTVKLRMQQSTVPSTIKNRY